MGIDLNRFPEAVHGSPQVDEKHRNRAKTSHDKKLQAGKSNVVHRAHELVDDENLYGKGDGAQKGDGVAKLQGKVFANAEQIQPDDGDGDADPRFRRTFLSEEKAQDGNDENVTCRQESGFSGGGPEKNSELLQVVSEGERRSAKDSGDQQRPLFPWRFGTFRAFAEFVENLEKSEKECRGDEAPEARENERSRGIPLDLGDKRSPPEKGGQNQQRTVTEICHGPIIGIVP